MNKTVAKKLKAKASEIARTFSNTDREFNYSNESFEVKSLVPLSEATALVIFEKSSDKLAIAFCYYINANNGEWRYFFPSDSHILGMEKVGKYLHQIEVKNFPKNFDA